MSRLHGLARRVALGALGAVLLVTLIGSAVPSARASSSSFCTAQQKVSLDTSSAAAVRKQAAKLLKSKPPAELAAALKAIKKSGSSSDAAKKALTVVAAFVASKCVTSSGSSSGGSSARCPLTAEQVSAALGATVDKDEASCTYYPPDGGYPNATFVRQLEMACTSSGLEALGYTETLAGLGEKAYVQRETAMGQSILVCADPPFEMIVDMPGNGDGALAAAQQLAKEALGS